MLDYHIGEIVAGADYTSMLTKPRCYCHGGIPSSRGNPGFIARKIYLPPDVVYFFSRWKYQYIAIFNSQFRLVFNVCSFLLTFLATMNATISHPSPLLTVADCSTLVGEKKSSSEGEAEQQNAKRRHTHMATSKNCFASDLWNFLEKISTFF